MTPHALTIAGSDSSGGAGIQADLKTFTVFRVYGMSAVTALTAQNTQGVAGVLPITADFVRAQIRAVADDVRIDAAKTGMLANADIIAAVADELRTRRIAPLVVDPVMVAESGASLLEPAACDLMRDEILPLAHLVTPNVPEASALLGMQIATVEDMRLAANRLIDLGAGAVLVKGGHLRSQLDAVDVFHDGTNLHELRAPRIPSKNTHGTGCMLSAAITACLARGLSLDKAVQEAKRFISTAIAAGLAIGKGAGPANPMAWLKKESGR
jgi:hydroxymethylpyrimidine/phosphomethylpyrimidine kinase